MLRMSAKHFNVVSKDSLIFFLATKLVHISESTAHEHPNKLRVMVAMDSVHAVAVRGPDSLLALCMAGSAYIWQDFCLV